MSETQTAVPADAPPIQEPRMLADAGQAGKIEVIRCADLHIDQTYQRDLSRDLVDTIKEDWDTMGAGYIVVNKRSNGALYIVNGQHRVAAKMELAMAAGDATGGEIVAQVFEGLSPQQEANLRLIGNTKRTDSSLERFRARIAAGKVESLAIRDILAQFNTKVNAAPDQKAGINCVSAVETIYRVDKGHLLTRVLEVVQDAFGTVGGSTASVAMLKGIAWIVTRHQAELDRKRLIERLAAAGIPTIEQRARAYKLSNGGALWANYYRAFVELYNHRLAERQRIEVRLGGWTRSALETESWQGS